jgi:hypothetical protein
MSKFKVGDSVYDCSEVCDKHLEDRVRRVSHSMALEGVALSEEFIKQQIDKLKMKRGEQSCISQEEVPLEALKLQVGDWVQTPENELVVIDEIAMSGDNVAYYVVTTTYGQRKGINTTMLRKTNIKFIDENTNGEV